MNKDIEYGNTFFKDYCLESTLKKVFFVLKKNKGLIKYHFSAIDNNLLTYTHFENAVCNHLLDDRPDEFNIKRIEGLRVRSFVQKYMDPRENPIAKQIIEKYFPNIFEGE